MDTKKYIVDPAQLDFDNPIANVEQIRQFNPQRYEMEQLSGIVYLDEEKAIGVGYKDVTENEFWVRGHMPGMPLMPGIVMCEAAAQVCSYITQRLDLLGADMVGFGGMEGVRFRGPVVPGDRLIVAAELLKVRRNKIILCRFQGIVGDVIKVDGQIKGIPLPLSSFHANP